MSYVNQDDGCTYLSSNEHYHVSGYVTLRVWVSFNTGSEPGDSGYDADLDKAVEDVVYSDWTLEDTSELVEEVEEDW